MTSFRERRVAVTGLGVITPLGHRPEELFERLCRGENGIRTIRRFDTSKTPSKIGGIIEGFEPELIVDDRAGRRMLRTADWIQTLGLCASKLAMDDAGLGELAVEPERLGVFLGAGRGGDDAMTAIGKAQLRLAREAAPDAELETLFAQLLAQAAQAVNPVHFLQQCPCLVSAYVAMRYQARGPTLTNVNLCSAGAQAIGEAAWVIARGDAEVMLAGGSDSMLNPVELTAFCALDAVSGNNDPDQASRPFDLRRDGCVVGEGAAVLVLEELSRARRRNARIYAEVAGYGSSSDAHKVSAPPEDGSGAVLAMRAALRHAGFSAEHIDHVNAHGTSTPLNDRIETHALKEVLGERAKRIPVVSTKSMTGHLIAAAGSLEAAISALCVANKRIPPTRNLAVRDPRCDLDYAAEGQRPMPSLRTVLSNSFAIGGSNACLIFADPEAGLPGARS